MKNKSLIAFIVGIIVVSLLLVPIADAKRHYNPHHGPTYRVKNYTKKNGTHVRSHLKTHANHTKRDNLYVDNH
jgi:uncharacterized membrane protein